MKTGNAGLKLALASALLAGTASMASAWTYDTQVIEYDGSSNIIGTRPGTTYSYRVGVITNDALEAQDLSVELNYHDGFIGQYLFSLDNGDTWLEVDKEAGNFTLSDVEAEQVIWLRAVIVYYRYLSTSPWGEADENVGDEYYFAFPPSGQYYDRGTTDVNKTGFVAVVHDSSVVIYKDLMWQQATADINSDAIFDHNDWLTHNDAIDYCNDLGFAGYNDWRLPSKEELKGLVVCTNGTPTPLVDYGEGNPNACDDGNSGLYDSPTIDSVFNSIAYNYWSADDASGVNKWQVNFGRGRSYPISGSVDIFVRCVRPGIYTDNDGDGQTPGTGDCNEADSTVYTGATEVCGDGIDQDCSGADLACVLQSCKTILENNPSSVDGVYLIDPDGDGGEAAISTYSDMTTDGGGWTMVASNSISDDSLPTNGTAVSLTTTGLNDNPSPFADYVIGLQMENLAFSEAMVEATVNGDVIKIKNIASSYPYVSPTSQSYTILVDTSGNGISTNSNYFVLGCEEFDIGDSANSMQNTTGAGITFSSSGDPSEGMYFGHGANEGSNEGYYLQSGSTVDANYYVTYVR